MVVGWCWQGEQSQDGVETCSSVQFCTQCGLKIKRTLYFLTFFQLLKSRLGNNNLNQIQDFNTFMRSTDQTGSKNLLYCLNHPPFTMSRLPQRHIPLFMFFSRSTHTMHVAYWTQTPTYTHMIVSKGRRECVYPQVCWQHTPSVQPGILLATIHHSIKINLLWRLRGAAFFLQPNRGTTP